MTWEDRGARSGINIGVGDTEREEAFQCLFPSTGIFPRFADRLGIQDCVTQRPGFVSEPLHSTPLVMAQTCPSTF